MATYTPKNLIGPAAVLTSTPTVYVSGSGIAGLMRTLTACAKASGKTLTVAFGADGATTRLWDAQPLTANQVYTQNGWWLTAVNSAHAMDFTSNATGNDCIAHASGYEVT